MPGPMPYERFDAWKVSHELALAVYAATRGWPRSELYSLTAQLCRAALSAPTNIAEGSAKRGPAEFRRFLDDSLGSLSELAYLLRFARDGQFLTDEAWAKLQQMRDKAAILTWRLAHSPAPAPLPRLTGDRTAPILNRMVSRSSTLNRTFAAIADPTRRAMLERLRRQRPLSVSELARPFPVSLPAILKHLNVLSAAGLIICEKSGRTVTCRLNARPMKGAMQWMGHYERYWSRKLDRLAAFVETEGDE